MGPGHRLGNEASDLNCQVPSQRQWKRAAQTKGELTTGRTRHCRPSPRIANFSVRLLAKAWPLSGRPNYRCGSQAVIDGWPLSASCRRSHLHRVEPIWRCSALYASRKRKPRHAGGSYSHCASGQFSVRRREKPRPARPRPRSASVAGSGIGDPKFTESPPLSIMKPLAVGVTVPPLRVSAIS